MVAIYDCTLGGISLPTYEQDFVQTVGGDYELVGAAVMPGAPRPASLYTINIPIYGDPTETDPTAVGLAKRAQVVALLQNALVRYQGLQFTSTFDPAIDGWLVIGTADVAYGDGGAGFGDFMLRIAGAAIIPAQQTLLGLRLLARDTRVPGTHIDRLMRHAVGEQVPHEAVVRHYLPVGADDVVGQAQPLLPAVGTYETLHGKAPYIDARVHGELVTYERPWADVGKGDVAVYDRNGNTTPAYTAAGDLDPQGVYGWVRIYGRSQLLQQGDVPVLDNGRCRVRYTGNGTWACDVCEGGRYVPGPRFDLGYPQLRSVALAEWTPEHAVLRVALADKGARADVYLHLQRGWPGPTVDVYHQGAKRQAAVAGQAHHVWADGWEHLRVGFTRAEGLVQAAGTPVLVPRA